MKKTLDYQIKLNGFKPQTLFPLLGEAQQDFLQRLALDYRLTFQEFRQLAEASRDLQMWGEDSLQSWWEKYKPDDENQVIIKTKLLKDFRDHFDLIKLSRKSYSDHAEINLPRQESSKIVSGTSDRTVFGECPVQSPRTVCCNLKTIDAVESCVFGCSYCTIQTFYKDRITVDSGLADKLKNIKLDPDKNYHFGSGQSSDSLAFGNREGILDALCDFAASNPNILLEFKTKSDNIKYFQENDTPGNIICSWTLNPQIIIDNEEHFTASLDRRIAAARAVADRGVMVSFHFHPIVYYDAWKKDYTSIAKQVQEKFAPHEILFISFGSVTFIKPVLQKIRKLGMKTKIHQMPLVPDPHGKMTYPDEIKIEKFSTMFDSFKAWHEKVFFYLCMEKASIWEESFGSVYPDNASFEKALFASSLSKFSPSGT